MGKPTFTITPGVIIEHIDSEAMVLLPGSTSVLRLTSDQANTLRAIESDQSSAVSIQEVQSLIDAGIVTTHPAMSRRNLIKAGAIGAGAGIAVMAMPAVAAASSGPVELAPPPEPVEVGDFTFIVLTDNGVTVGQVGILDQKNAPPPADLTEGTLKGGGLSQTYKFFAQDDFWVSIGTGIIPLPPETLEYEVEGTVYIGVYVEQ